MTTDAPTVTDLERRDLLDTLASHRDFLRHTVRGLTDGQARQTPTASQLCLGGIIKHVTLVEEGWARFIVEGPSAMGSTDEAAYEAHAAGFRMLDGETLDGLLARYEGVARATDELVLSLPSLDASHPLPEAPWFEPGGASDGPPGVPPHHRRDRTARRARRHHPGDDRRRQDDGLTVGHGPVGTGRAVPGRREWHAVTVPEAPAPADGRTQFERMVAGDLYRSDDPEIVAAHHRAVGLVDRFNRTPVDDADGRRAILTELLGRLGTGSVIRPPLACDYGSFLHIGAHTFVNFGLVALDAARITIGDHVQIGPNVQLLTPTHPLDPDLRRDGWEAAGPITLGDNVWLGGGVIVLADVTIGEDTVVGAGAVVTRDLPSGVVAVGSPARIIRRLDRDSSGPRR